MKDSGTSAFLPRLSSGVAGSGVSELGHGTQVLGSVRFNSLGSDVGEVQFTTSFHQHHIEDDQSKVAFVSLEESKHDTENSPVKNLPA